MPKLCEQLSWLNDLAERGIDTDKDRKLIMFIRRKLIAIDRAKEKVDELQNMMAEEGA